MAKIGISPGHGGSDKGAVSADSRFVEKGINLKMGLEMKKLLEASGHTVIISRTTDVAGGEASFAQRIDGQVDFAIACHENAFNQSANGTEILCNTNAARAKSRELSKLMLDAALKAMPGIVNRGLKDSAFAMNRYSYPCAYLETCFIDSFKDQKFVDTDAKINTIAAAYVNAVNKYCQNNNLMPEPISNPSLATPSTEYTQGQVVQFAGGEQFKSSDATAPSPTKASAGTARITQPVNKNRNGIHLQGITSSVHGWVNPSSVSAIPGSQPNNTSSWPATPFTIRINASELNVRTDSGLNFQVRQTLMNDKNQYTIVETKQDSVGDWWGKLKSGAGWVSLKFCRID